ncbi:MAG TPA: hypothetical protein VG498_01070 [Terriglobales bacterium]|nr:hypothetical protein [Terriglobales bacterium]
MKPALVFALGALGLLVLAKYQRSGRRTPTTLALEPPMEPQRQRRTRRMRHRTEDGLLDINSATRFELNELTGITNELAARIIENRPYLTKMDLIGRRVIPDTAYEVIKHAIAVRYSA